MILGHSLVVVVTDRPGLRSEISRGKSRSTNGWTLRIIELGTMTIIYQIHVFKIS